MPKKRYPSYTLFKNNSTFWREQQTAIFKPYQLRIGSNQKNVDFTNLEQLKEFKDKTLN
jgi:hypothetical protein